MPRRSPGGSITKRVFRAIKTDDQLDLAGQFVRRRMRSLLALRVAEWRQMEQQC